MGGVYGPSSRSPSFFACASMAVLLWISSESPNILRQQRRRRAVAKASENSLNAKFGTVSVHHRYITATSPVWRSTGSPAPSDRARTAGEGMPCSRGYYGFLCTHKRRPRLWPPCPARRRIGHRTAAKRSYSEGRNGYDGKYGALGGIVMVKNNNEWLESRKKLKKRKKRGAKDDRTQRRTGRIRIPDGGIQGADRAAPRRRPPQEGRRMSADKARRGRC